jgi:hypothetical protein
MPASEWEASLGASVILSLRQISKLAESRRAKSCQVAPIGRSWQKIFESRRKVGGVAE